MIGYLGTQGYNPKSALYIYKVYIDQLIDWSIDWF